MPRRSELRITKRTVDALTVGEKDTVFWDRALAGFGVRVHATGRKTYVVQSRGPSGPKRVTLGLHGDLSADEARKQAAVVIDRIKRGEDPVPVVPETELTVAALAERFMRVHVEVHCKPRTIDTYRGVLELHIMPALGGMALSAVGRREIAALHHGLRDKPCTANAAVRVASSMFQRAEAWRRTMIKILGFDTGGYWIWSKRLEQGQFALGRGAQELKRELNRTALLALVDGVDIKIIRQRKRHRQAA